MSVTASTGIAACNIGGTTLHSFSGVGLGTAPKERLFQFVCSNKKTISRWKQTKVLVIDESECTLRTCQRKSTHG